MAQQPEVGSSSTHTAKLRVAGAWSGQIEVSLDDWTVSRLRSHLAALSGFPVDSINLISAGKNLKDDTKNQRSLRQVGVGCNSKILMTRVGTQQASSLIAEKERVERLARIKAAVDAMAKRSNEDAYPTDDFDIQLENQSGEKLSFQSDSDRRALIMGLMLYAKARNILQEGHYLEALEVLDMAEEAFSLCNPEILEVVDNVALLQIDIVWCYFMTKDITRLSIAGKRLSQAREGLRRSHGPRLERLRVLQGGFRPELAIYVRLELLEGIVAFHSGNFEITRQALTSAQSKYQQLQVSDELLALLTGMGFHTKESQRALRVSGQDVNRAVEFLMEERRKKSEKYEEDRRHQKQRREQRLYGKTAAGKAVDILKVDELSSIGYERNLAAEALRRTENDREAALDLLTDPIQNSAMQSMLFPSRHKRHKKVDEAILTELTAMGFQLDKVIQAVQHTDDKAQALEELLRATPSTTDAQTSSSAREDENVWQESSLTDSEDDNTLQENDPEPSLRDEEMEEDIAKNLTGDPLAEYDIEVEKEGEAISQYLSMLNDTVSTT